MMRKSLIFGAALSLSVVASGPLVAAEQPPLAKQSWSFKGMFGTFDKAAMQRGYQVFRDVCSSCHSLKFVAFRDLEALGFTAKQVKAIAAEHEVPAPPNDEGEIFKDGERIMRKALPSDRIIGPFANENAARAANNGALPPDLSLVTKARIGGADYIYGVLTGYKETPPKGFKLTEGAYYNTAFRGHQIAMPPPLADGAVDYADGTKATLAQEAHDVVTFLSWAAEPELEGRKRLGIKVLLFLIVLTGLLYAVKKKVWAKVH